MPRLMLSMDGLVLKEMVLEKERTIEQTARYPDRQSWRSVASTLR